MSQPFGLVLAASTIAGAAVLAPTSAAAAVAAPVPAGGPTLSATATPQPAAAPPACVSVRVDDPGFFYQSVFVTNGCPITQRVKVLWAFATDSACHPISPGETYEDHHFLQSGADRFDGVESC